jgi:hypothetical protein
VPHLLFTVFIEQLHCEGRVSRSLSSLYLKYIFTVMGEVPCPSSSLYLGNSFTVRGGFPGLYPLYIYSIAHLHRDGSGSIYETASQ